jgi:hypothetical protein
MKTFRKWKKHKNKTRKKKQKNKILKGGVIFRRNNGSQPSRPGSRLARQETALAKQERKIKAGWRHAIRTSEDMGCNKAAFISFQTEYDDFKQKRHLQPWKQIIGDFVDNCDVFSHLKDLSVKDFEKKLIEKTLLIPDASKSPRSRPLSPLSPLSPLYGDNFTQ